MTSPSPPTYNSSSSSSEGSIAEESIPEGPISEGDGDTDDEADHLPEDLVRETPNDDTLVLANNDQITISNCYQNVPSPPPPQKSNYDNYPANVFVSDDNQRSYGDIFHQQAHPIDMTQTVDDESNSASSHRERFHDEVGQYHL